MSRYAQKKGYRAKDDFPVKFGFEYNQNAINYRTQIPPLPEKPKHKPDDKLKEKKVHDIEDKIQKLKTTRKENKEEIKRLNTSYDSEMETLKDHVTLGRKCILVLEFDVDKINEEISRKSGVINKMQNKIDKLISEVKDLKRENRPNKKVKKEYQEMSNRELDEEKARIQQIMSTKVLDKKQETELNSLIYKIQRVKMDPNRNVEEEPLSTEETNLQKIYKLEDDIARTKEKQNKIKTERFDLFKSRDQIQFKIIDIRTDIEGFFVKLKEIADIIDSNEHVQQLTEESKTIKESIVKLKEDIAKINTDFDEKIKQYEMEQEKIKWIEWATNIQEKRKEEWEEEKAERKKQKAREKAQAEKEGVKTKEGQKEGKDSKEVKEDKPIQRKKLNKNQKQIDTCAYLIDYCKRLYPLSAENQGKKTGDKNELNLNDELKKGTWAKEKVEVLQSKKSKGDQEDTPKAKYNKKKHHKQHEEVVAPNRFSHNFFVAQSFDAVKILPPTSLEELDKIIKDLEDKVEYYLSHPEESVQQKFAKDKEYLEGTAQGDKRGKNTKSKGSSKNIINTEEFPAL